MKNIVFALITLFLVQQNASAKSEEMTSYSMLKNMWSHASGASEAALTGNWKVVAVDRDDRCSSVSPQANDASGLKNSDGSFWSSLFFTRNTNLPASRLSVTVKNIGAAGMNQGPLRVGSSEPQFLQHAYGYDGQINPRAWYAFSCRLSQEVEYSLICAGSLQVEVTLPESDENFPGIDPGAMNCMSISNGVLIAYKKL